jgi:hypothetical protein
VLDYRLTDHLKRLGAELLVWLLPAAACLATFYLLGPEPWRVDWLAGLADALESLRTSH